jgi:hypothetical protein
MDAWQYVVLPLMQLGFQATNPWRKQVAGTPVHNDRRFSHTWVMGKTRVGKSTALKNWVLDDIAAGEGILFLDPHGDAIEQLLPYIPPERRDDVILCDLGDFAYPIALNILDQVPPDRRPFVAGAVVSIFKDIWKYTHASTPQLDQYLYNGTAALLEMPDSTLLGLNYMLKNSGEYRSRVTSHVLNQIIRDFWDIDFKDIPDRERRQSVLSTLNKIGMLVADPVVRNIIGQPRMSFSIKDIMDSGKILLVSVPQGKLGIEKSSILGSFVLALVHLAALERPIDHRRPFHVFVDEAHNFGGSLLCEMLSGIGKFGVSLTLAHQYLYQLTARSEELREALIGTAGTIVAFRLGVTDAETMAPEFALEREDILLPQLPPYMAYARIEETWLLDMPDVSRPTYSFDFRTDSRKRYATQRSHVERRIARFIDGT